MRRAPFPTSLLVLATLLTSTGSPMAQTPPPPTAEDERPDAARLSVHRDDGLVVVRADDVDVLTYHCEVDALPDGVPSVFARSGFVHPLRTLSGAVVTGAYPRDHHHHTGLWHAWVRTEHDGATPDFWNLAAGTGRVRHRSVEAVRDAGFTVRQEQVALHADGREIVVLDERLHVDASIPEPGVLSFDYRIDQRNVTDAPLVLPAYRYGGGIAFRGPASWNAGNSNYLTSAGLERTDSHATRAEWVAMYGPGVREDEEKDQEEAPATVAILCHPGNLDAPQRIRTWDDGRVFFNYVPVQAEGTRIEPGETLSLRYRVLVHDGTPDPERLARLWDAYRRDGAEEAGLPLGFVLVREAVLPSRERLVAAAADHGLTLRRLPQRPTPDGADRSDDLQTYALEGGGQLALALLPFPHPDAAAVCTGAFSPSVTDATACPAHYLVSLVDVEGDARSVDATLARALAAVVESAPAVGAMLGHAGALHRPEVFAEVGADQTSERLPVEVCLDLTVAAAGDDRVSVLTHGMPRYGREDLLVYAPRSKGPREVFGFVYAMAAFALARSPEHFAVGDTVGRTPDEKVRVERASSPVDPSRTVLVLRM